MVKNRSRQALADMDEPLRRRFQHKYLRERGYVFAKISVGAGTNWADWELVLFSSIFPSPEIWLTLPGLQRIRGWAGQAPGQT